MDAKGGGPGPAVPEDDCGLGERDDCRCKHEPAEQVSSPIDDQNRCKQTGGDVANCFCGKVGVPSPIRSDRDIEPGSGRMRHEKKAGAND